MGGRKESGVKFSREESKFFRETRIFNGLLMA